MPRFRVVPTHEGGHGFSLWLKHDRIAEVVGLTKSDYEVRLGKDAYRLITKSDFGVKYQLLDGDGATLATAQRASSISPRYEIKTAANVALAMAPIATFGRKYRVVRDELIVGFIDPDDLMSQSTVVELPENVSFVEVAFLVWVHREVATSR